MAGAIWLVAGDVGSFWGLYHAGVDLRFDGLVLLACAGGKWWSETKETERRSTLSWSEAVARAVICGMKNAIFLWQT
jgi:hypothetical protein